MLKIHKYILGLLICTFTGFAAAWAEAPHGTQLNSLNLMACPMAGLCADMLTTNTLPLWPDTFVTGPNAARTPNANIYFKGDASDNYRFNTGTGKSYFWDFGDTLTGTPTPGASLNSSTGFNTLLAGEGYNYGPAYVPTLVATPVAGTNYFAPGLNVIPTNAANNAGFLGANATPVVGQHFTINNASGAAQRVKASGGATLNGATAGGYIVLASLATVECYIVSATNQVCEQPVIPTPSGP